MGQPLGEPALGLFHAQRGADLDVRQVRQHQLQPVPQVRGQRRALLVLHVADFLAGGLENPLQRRPRRGFVGPGGVPHQHVGQGGQGLELHRLGQLVPVADLGEQREVAVQQRRVQAQPGGLLGRLALEIDADRDLAARQAVLDQGPGALLEVLDESRKSK